MEDAETMDDRRRERVTTFFRPPTEEAYEGDVSTLHLLRRELQDCLIGEVVEEQQFLRRVSQSDERHHRLFATLMVIFAGVDLLAKFTKPRARGRKREQKRERKRAPDDVVRFLHRFVGLPEEKAEAVWDIRNALMHSFGLHVDNGQRKVPLAIHGGEGEVVERSRDGGWVLNIDSLTRAFVTGIDLYRKALDGDPDLQEAFTEQFPKRGTLRLSGPHIP